MSKWTFVGALACLVSFVSGYYIASFQSNDTNNNSTINDMIQNISFEEDSDEEEFEEDYDEYRMILIIRSDLKMTKGKVIAQCCHGTLCLFSQCLEDSQYHESLKQWIKHGQTKITLKCPNEEAMQKVKNSLNSEKVNIVEICDAGRTQIASGSWTVLGLGPLKKSECSEELKSLKLY